METVGSINKPIVIEIDKDDIRLVLADGESEVDLENGVSFDDEDHYGFILKSNIEIAPKEQTFPTNNPLRGIFISDGKILIYERNVKRPWQFGADGLLVRNNVITSDEYKTYVVNGEVRKKSNDDVVVVLEHGITEAKYSYIEYAGKKHPLMNGIVFGDEVYGFKVAVKGPENKGITEYATEGSLYGIQGINDERGQRFLVYEDNKTIPWEFTPYGELRQESEFAKTLKTEKDAYLQRYGITEEQLMQELNGTTDSYVPTLK